MAVARHITYQEQITSSISQSMVKDSFKYFVGASKMEEAKTYEDPQFWDQFFLHPQDTPPGSPQRDDDVCILDLNSLDPQEPHMQTMPTSELFDCEQTSIRSFRSPVLVDCMWSGAEKKPKRVRNVSLSELNMVSTSTSCIDPTTFTAYPRQHNQVEHNYSLVTPEPMTFMLYNDYYNTPSASEVSGDEPEPESEEDLIDVETVDSSSITTPTLIHTKSHSKTSVYRVRQNLHQVAKKLSSHPYKRPKCLNTSDIVPAKKQKQFLASPDSLTSSLSGSDCEEYGVKRSAHNVMERRRRSELRDHLHTLRDQLPMESERPAKVMILVKATHAIKQFEAQDRALRHEYKALKADNTRLKVRLAELQAQFTSSF